MLVQHAQQLERSTIGQSVMYEVIRPDAVGLCRSWNSDVIATAALSHASHNIAKLPLEISVLLSRRQVQAACSDWRGGVPPEPLLLDISHSPLRGDKGEPGQAKSTNDVRGEPHGQGILHQCLCPSHSRATTDLGDGRDKDNVDEPSKRP
jgi:hypothetical protein